MAIRNSAYAMVQEVAKARRSLRRPQHRHQLRTRPYQIQPFLLAPVLPGETMRNLLLQARVVTDPLKNPLIGWWKEYYFFYVKHRDLEERDDLTAMVLDPTHDTSTLNESASTLYYHAGNTINWSKLCLKRVVDEYFRHEGETFNDGLLDTLPTAAVNTDSWMDSLTDAGDVANVDIDLTDVGSPGGAAVTTSEIEESMRQWEMLRTQGLTDMSYEDYLSAFGVRQAKQIQESHKPELIRYVRDWSYPSNTINPADGAPSSAVSWVISERADKDRYFAEPGFVFGVTVARPKMYFANQKGSAAGLMNDAYRWLPAMLHGDPRLGFKEIPANNTGPISTNDGYWVDVRDLLMYGDQFVNFPLSEDNGHLFALPGTTPISKRFASESDINELFVDEVTDRLIREDGIVTLGIASTQKDMSATTVS